MTEALDCCEPFAAFFNMARIQLEGLTEPPNNNLAIKLGNTAETFLTLRFVFSQLAVGSFPSRLI